MCTPGPYSVFTLEGTPAKGQEIPTGTEMVVWWCLTSSGFHLLLLTDTSLGLSFSFFLFCSVWGLSSLGSPFIKLASCLWACASPSHVHILFCCPLSAEPSPSAVLSWLFLLQDSALESLSRALPEGEAWPCTPLSPYFPHYLQLLTCQMCVLWPSLPSKEALSLHFPHLAYVCSYSHWKTNVWMNFWYLKTLIET